MNTNARVLRVLYHLALYCIFSKFHSYENNITQNKTDTQSSGLIILIFSKLFQMRMSGVFLQQREQFIYMLRPRCFIFSIYVLTVSLLRGPRAAACLFIS